MIVAETCRVIKEGVRMGITGEVSKDWYLKSLTESENKFLQQILGYLEKYNESFGTKIWVAAVGSSVANTFNQESYNDIDLAIYNSSLDSSSHLIRQLTDIFRRKETSVKRYLTRRDIGYPIDTLLVGHDESSKSIDLLFYDSDPERNRDEHRRWGTRIEQPWSSLLYRV